ncbi:MAG: hypothetical protein LBH04_10870 [Tannerellaceae bacterium]|nr:hypothetical protein [Tannerellaceae bacterium]
MKHVKFTTLLLILLCLPTAAGGATEMQKELKIHDVFRQYWKKKNVTMVELSREMLDTYSLAHYRSITIKGYPEALTLVRRCLAADQEGAKKIKEVTDGGEVVSAYYQLPGETADVNRFILFKVGAHGEITLVYIEGAIDGDDLITILFTKQVYK